MALAQDAVTTRVVESDVTSTSWSHTCSGSNRLLLVFLAVGGDCNPTVTYNGVPLTQIKKVGTSGVARYGFLYRLIAPAAGTYTIAVSGFPNGYIKAYAVSLTDVNQTTPLGPAASATGNSNSLSVNVSSNDNLLVYDFGWISGGGGGSSYTPGAGQTELLDYNTQTYISATGSRKAGSTTTSMTHTATVSAPWGIIGVSVNVDAQAPSVTTGSATEVKKNMATLGGEVTADNDSIITERGVCWSTSANPTISDSKATSIGTTGAYTVAATGLNPGTVYHYRAYATNGVGTSYGSDQTFETKKASGGAFLLNLI